MKSTLRIILILLLGGMVCSGALAEEDPGEDTIVVVAVGATPEDIVNVIELPPRASSTAGDHATANDNNAHDATEFASEFGKQVAEEAKSKNINKQIRDDLEQNARRDARGNNRRDPPNRYGRRHCHGLALGVSVRGPEVGSRPSATWQSPATLGRVGSSLGGEAEADMMTVSKPNL